LNLQARVITEHEQRRGKIEGLTGDASQVDRQRIAGYERPQQLQRQCRQVIGIRVGRQLWPVGRHIQAAIVGQTLRQRGAESDPVQRVACAGE
jgi:hypothetical protein